ncbi:GNAT family N-acetyltransferase [Chitinimonas sp. BJYL2]|uniref:GNAT family N-acetyltransferase n=1 Tax=Chitinimonas sp. BJYL2 TaxID=2976696 RepID=UPI0022B3C7ED|nr:GNAT family N-acetyltransferase [Chitinimonas sp. BJYL2]
MSPAAIRIRPINPASDIEITLVAARMRATLIEVEGEAAGTAMYSLDWLQDRVRFHLDGRAQAAQVLLAELPDGQIAGHTIVRVEQAGEAGHHGLFSTSYVAPEHRRGGIASALLGAGEDWLLSQHVPELATWTSATNHGLIALYARFGYAVTETHPHATTGTAMVRLTRRV